jgi:hypothetical protein
VGEIGGLGSVRAMSTVLSRRRFAHDAQRRLSTLSTTRRRFHILRRIGHLFARLGRTAAAPCRPSIAQPCRRTATCAVRHSVKFFLTRRRMVSAPSPNRPEPTQNRGRPRTEGMGCEGEGRACSRGRAVVITTPHCFAQSCRPGSGATAAGLNCPASGGAFFLRSPRHCRALRDAQGLRSHRGDGTPACSGGGRSTTADRRCRVARRGVPPRAPVRLSGGRARLRSRRLCRGLPRLRGARRRFYNGDTAFGSTNVTPVADAWTRQPPAVRSTADPHPNVAVPNVATKVGQ